MNIYDFLRSPDIAAHCEKIGHVFNPLEMAVIIAISGKTMKVKHEAWRQIIAEYHDMPISASNYFKAQESLHEYLRELIRREERGLLEFYDYDHRSNSCVYRPSLVYGDKSISDNFGCFRTAAAALEAVRLDNEEYEESWFKPAYVRIYKEFVYSDYTETDHENYYREEIWVNSAGEELMCDGAYKDYPDWPDQLDMIFIHIPLPFEKGDLVEFVGCDDVGPCVLRDLPHWQPNYERRLSGEMSDGSDMIAWIYFMDEEGQLIFNDCPCFLYELKSYTGEYKGYDRFLPYLSYYMKEKKEAIDVLIYSYSRIKALTEYENNTDLLYNSFDWWTKFVKEM